MTCRTNRITSLAESSLKFLLYYVIIILVYFKNQGGVFFYFEELYVDKMLSYVQIISVVSKAVEHILPINQRLTTSIHKTSRK